MMDQDDCNDCADVAVSIEGAISRVFEIVNRKGLHARATAKFVQCAESFDAEIFVSRCGETVGGSSIMGILTLGAGIGSTITVSARGPQAQEALEGIGALIANRFGEDE
jgi:phosphocarrier protein